MNHDFGNKKLIQMFPNLLRPSEFYDMGLDSRREVLPCTSETLKDIPIHLVELHVAAEKIFVIRHRLYRLYFSTVYLVTVTVG